MSDITINYKGNAIATMDASGTKTLLTDGKYCEDDIEVVYVKPSGGGSGITKETVSYTTTGENYSNAIPISGDVTKILFVHFYDNDAAYPTNNTTYEGMKIGPALAHFNETAASMSWAYLRTNSSGTTGFSSYSGSPAFDQAGYVTVSTNPKIPAGHTIKLNVFYTS